jgi:hypothetical protein
MFVSEEIPPNEGDFLGTIANFFDDDDTTKETSFIPPNTGDFL